MVCHLPVKTAYLNDFPEAYSFILLVFNDLLLYKVDDAVLTPAYGHFSVNEMNVIDLDHFAPLCEANRQQQIF